MAQNGVEFASYNLPNSASIPDSENEVLTDEELIERVGHGDTSALGMIFDRF